MKLDRVTITGADDSVKPQSLIELSREFPFVEWGILASHHGAGARFPSQPWIDALREDAFKEMALSLHLCGRWVRDLLIGVQKVPSQLYGGFGRVQLNFHAENTPCSPKEFHSVLRKLGDRQFIFQIDGNGGNSHLESLFSENGPNGFVDAVPLFDISGGAGVLPDEWPKPVHLADDKSHIYHGYAGGLGPENLEQQIELIGKAAGETPIWIDMETRVRSNCDLNFDLVKVRRCLEIAKPFIS